MRKLIIIFNRNPPSDPPPQSKFCNRGLNFSRRHVDSTPIIQFENHTTAKARDFDWLKPNVSECD